MSEKVTFHDVLVELARVHGDLGVLANQCENTEATMNVGKARCLVADALDELEDAAQEEGEA